MRPYMGSKCRYNCVYFLESYNLQFTALLHLGGTLHGRAQFHGRILLLHVTIQTHDRLVPLGRALCKTTTGLTLATFVLLHAAARAAALLVFARTNICHSTRWFYFL